MYVNFMAINFAKISIISFAANIFSAEELKRSIKTIMEDCARERLLVRYFVHIFVQKILKV